MSGENTNGLTLTVIELAQARQHARELGDTLARARAGLEEIFRQTHGEAIQAHETIKLHVTDLENSVRDLALRAFSQDKTNKQPAPGVGIRVTTSPDYDKAAAFGWAKTHGLALQLDTKAFNDICKSDSTRPDFVTITETPVATIATDLTSLLGEGK